MRLQLSVEWLIYIGVAALALLSSISMLAAKSSFVEWHIASYAFSEFSFIINNHISGANTSFTAYVPVGACNSTFTGHGIKNGYGTFDFVAEIRVAGNALCPDGVYKELEISPDGVGQYVMSCKNCN